MEVSEEVSGLGSEEDIETSVCAEESSTIELSVSLTEEVSDSGLEFSGEV